MTGREYAKALTKEILFGSSRTLNVRTRFVVLGAPIAAFLAWAGTIGWLKWSTGEAVMVGTIIAMLFFLCWLAESLCVVPFQILKRETDKAVAEALAAAKASPAPQVARMQELVENWLQTGREIETGGWRFRQQLVNRWRDSVFRSLRAMDEEAAKDYRRARSLTPERLAEKIDFLEQYLEGLSRGKAPKYVPHSAHRISVEGYKRTVIMMELIGLVKGIDVYRNGQIPGFDPAVWRDKAQSLINWALDIEVVLPGVQGLSPKEFLDASYKTVDDLADRVIKGEISLKSSALQYSP